MDNTAVALPQLNESSPLKKLNNNNSAYVSFIRIHGKPILPPLLTEEERLELQKYKQKAIEKELKLSQLKQKNSTEPNQISSEVSSISNVPPNRQSTPARPSSLKLVNGQSGATAVLIEKPNENLTSTTTTTTNGSTLESNPSNHDTEPSQKIVKDLNKVFKSTVEQRLANDEEFLRKSKLVQCKKSPIFEECVTDKCIDSDSDSFSERKRWSPLQMESINLLKVKFPAQEFPSENTDCNLEVSLDESQHTPDTVTQSPSLMRQNSYTLLTPSPALLNFLEAQREQDNQRTQARRKTWDLTKAKKNWDPEMDGGPLHGSCFDHSESSEVAFTKKKNASSLESYPALNEGGRVVEDMYSLKNDSETSPESCGSNRSPQTKFGKAKTKGKGKKNRTCKSVPSPKWKEKVPSHDLSGSASVFVPYVSESTAEMSELSNLLLQMKFDHERQKKELEERQRTEIKRLEMLFQRKESERFSNVSQTPKKSVKSIYSQRSGDGSARERDGVDARMMGDGDHNGLKIHCRRPHSAKDIHLQEVYTFETDCNRRTRSMDFAQANQDTDLDVSFQDDYTHSRDTTLNNDYIIESDSVSNFSSRSSTISSDNRHCLPSSCNLKKFQGISTEEYAKYNQAATVITAAARGFLTRRLLRTAHVQGLITTLRDAITCATQLHTASDIADSDIDLMRRLSRQIEAAWDAVYAVFFNTETSVKLQLIAADRERLKVATSKTSASSGVKKKRISSATKKFLDRKKGNTVMSKSQTSNGFSRVRVCSKMSASYPSPYFSPKLK